MSRGRHPVTIRIDEAVELLQKYGEPITLPSVKTNAKRRLTWADFSSDEALDAVVDQRLSKRLKELGIVIVDAEEGERKLFDDCTLVEFDEQIAVKQRNVTYVSNRLRADKAVREFLAEKQAMAEEPLRIGDFRDDVDSIYAAHGFAITATPDVA